MSDELDVVPARLQLAAEPSTILDGKVHVGFAVGLTSDGKASAVVVPDVTGVIAGTAPVYLAKPVKLKLEKLYAYLDKKADGATKSLKDNPALTGFLNATSVSVDSLYYKRASIVTPAKVAPDTPAPEVRGEDQILLMQFALNFTEADAKADATAKVGQGSSGGLIGALTGDKDLSELFDITGLSVRVLCCKGDENVKTLQNYVDGLFAD
jgi:hypothetical protein